MSISPRLAALTHERFEAWRRAHTARNARPALFTFAGDVYEGLEAGTLDGPAMAALSDAETFYFVRPQPLPRSSRS